MNQHCSGLVTGVSSSTQCASARLAASAPRSPCIADCAQAVPVCVILTPQSESAFNTVSDCVSDRHSLCIADCAPRSADVRRVDLGRKAQAAERLGRRHGCGRHIGHHQHLCVPAQAWLQQPRLRAESTLSMPRCSQPLRHIEHAQNLHAQSIVLPASPSGCHVEAWQRRGAVSTGEGGHEKVLTSLLFLYGM
jgi:hypothetical protein